MGRRGASAAAWVGTAALASLAVGCARPGDGGGTAGELLEADRRFATATLTGREQAWASWFADDGVMILPGAEVQGPQAIQEAMAGLFSDPTYVLTWEPEREEIAASGDLGYTVGRFVGTFQDPRAGKVERTGQYVTIWRRNDSGAWEVALDVGIPDPEPSAPTPEGVAAPTPEDVPATLGDSASPP